MKESRSIVASVMVFLTAIVMWANHPWLTKVYEYRPAPGQFINTLPVARVGDPVDSVLSRCQASICGRVDTTTATINGQMITQVDTTWAESMISLGGYGGYVIVGFDHPVVNSHDYDFEIWGNAFVSNLYSQGGGSEPGIVMVGVDYDGNGVPSDGDKWYELAGSEHNHPGTQHDYSITYYRPDEGKQRTPSLVNPYLNDTTYIRWTSNDVNPDSTSGYMSRNTYHLQPYWPLWLQQENSLTFSGTKLHCNAVNQGNNNGNDYYLLYFFEWGYVDNLPNYSELTPDALHNPGFKIDWAVDGDGNHVDLTHIDFVKVYNGLNQYCGWLGETSTEVAGGIDFHPDAVMPALPPGDVNGDGEVGIADVNVLIEMVLSGTFHGTGDMNGDSEISIADVNALIDLILQ